MGSSGSFRSYGFPEIQPEGVDYAICFRRERGEFVNYPKEASGKNITVTVHVGFCSYQLSESNENSFMLSEAITDTDKVISSPQT